MIIELRDAHLAPREGHHHPNLDFLDSPLYSPPDTELANSSNSDPGNEKDAEMGGQPFSSSLGDSADPDGMDIC